MSRRGPFVVVRTVVCAIVCTFAVAGCFSDPSGGGGYNGNNGNGWYYGGADGGLFGGYDAGGSFGNIGTGGAQDIGQFRKILDEGGIPGENTLDANGFFSEHHTELPPPECAQVLCLHGMLAVHRDWVRDGYQAALQLAMNSPLDPSTFTRRPLDLVVVVDTSGSMGSSDKIDYVKQGLHLLIDAVEPEDRLALVTYNTTVTVEYYLNQPFNAVALHAIIDSISASGSTNFYDGLETGLSMAATAWDPAREPRVIILSDGLPTAGVTDQQSIINMADIYIADGIGLTTIGVGLSFNVDLMRGLAERGAGNFYFLENTAAIDEVFTEELNYFVTPIAFDLVANVTVAPAYDLGEVVGTTLWTANGNGGTINIPSVFLASRTSHDDPPAGNGEGRRGGGSAIIMAVMPDANWQGATDPYQVAYLHLTYTPADQATSLEQSVYVLNPALPGEHPSDVEPEDAWVSHVAMQKNYAMYNVFLGLREACRCAAVNYNHALWVLDQLKARAETWNMKFDDEDIVADIELIDRFRTNLMTLNAQPEEPAGPCQAQ